MKETTKRCPRCKLEKSINKFYNCKTRKDGKAVYCKKCSYEKHKKWLMNNKDYYIKYRKKNVDKRDSWYDRYNKNNTNKILAQRKANYAVKTGQIKKEPCAVCGKSNAEMHHPDYNLPLDVVFLCSKHHKDVHKITRDAGLFLNKVN